MNYDEKSVKLHRKFRGKISIKPKVKLSNRYDLSLAYTPGVAAVSQKIADDKEASWELTNRANQVAIISDGTAVLGLGNIGPEAAMPVMEGKSAIFKEFADIDAIPLCINTTDPKEIIKFCQYIEPSFAGINLEDIAAPQCFAVLDELEKTLSIPVFHDDQDGTAIIALAALINAGRVNKINIKKLKIVINGAGAAGLATARLLLAYDIEKIIILDSQGTIYQNRPDINECKKQLAKLTNLNCIKGGLKEALVGADVFIGLSKGNLVNTEMVKSMNKNSIVFAMANPIPEIDPKAASAAGASIVGSGRSDLPNQINNALVFPGMFRGLLDYKIKKVTVPMKLKVAQAIANSIKPTKNKILPLVTEKRVVKLIAKAIKSFK